MGESCCDCKSISDGVAGSSKVVRLTEALNNLSDRKALGVVLSLFKNREKDTPVRVGRKNGGGRSRTTDRIFNDRDSSVTAPAHKRLADVTAMAALTT